MSDPHPWPSRVELVDVSLRDGLQDETRVWASEDKVDLARHLARAGVSRLELVSFARPDRVPQMADAERVVELARAEEDLRHVRLAGLALNERSLDRALACELDEINAVVIASDTFSQRNQGMSSADAARMATAVVGRARAAGLAATVTLSAAWGCPYEGEVAPQRVVELAGEIAAATSAPGDGQGGDGALEIALADTIGAADPVRVQRLVRAVIDETGLPVRAHLHDSRNTGVANALAAIQAGAVALDASFGGLGGCPFAGGASGNVGLEDLVHVLHRMGIDTGIDLEALLGRTTWLEEQVGHTLASQVSKSGPFPKPRP